VTITSECKRSTRRKRATSFFIDNGGRLDVSCWGGILANGAKMKGVSAVVIDGACRDLDD